MSMQPTGTLPAFPTVEYGTTVMEGITLWDYYAAAALSAISRDIEASRVVASRAAYIADAMIAEREERTNNGG